MKYKQYELWLADLNPRFGTESGKTRPVTIIQNDILNKIHPLVVICPITTNVKSGASILRVHLEKGDGGIKRKSSIMIDQIRAIDNRRLIKKIGYIPRAIHEKINKNLQIVLGFDY